MPTLARDRLGRRIRLGVIGGGSSAFIGPVHRAAATFDGEIEIVAAVLSSDPERSLAEGKAVGIRAYGTVEAMIAQERARDDGIDAVAIVTPNDSHFSLCRLALEAGLDVVCDKPLTNDIETAAELVRLAEAQSLNLVVTHNYSGYPMVREARAAIAAGEIGRIHLATVQYLQGGLSTLIERSETVPARTRWRLDPSRGGPSHVLADIGTHAHQLLTYVSNRRVERVLGRSFAAVPGRTAHDTAMALIELAGGVSATFLTSKAAAGAENAISIEVYGDAGGLSWSQAVPNHLRIMRQGRPAEVRAAGLPGLHADARRSCRLPLGHPEGFYEAFANLYSDFAMLVAARLTNTAPPRLDVPTHRDGYDGLAFIHACLESTATSTWAAPSSLPPLP